ncbi:MAG: hypothetical protein ACR2PZ_08470 [Pseudomonadales bacterium]
MNLKKLRDAEALFLQMYPKGFADEAMKAIGKKHNVDKLSEFASTALAKKNFVKQGQVIDDIVKIVSRSSMVSMFEKPKFRDYVNGLSQDDRDFLAGGFKKLLHGSQRNGFNEVLDVLTEGKLAKWSLMTICPHHYRPQKDVFVKPTTTKNVIRQFELEGLEYKPRPSWEFYAKYREAIDLMKQHTHPSLAPNNAAFTGFLMMVTSVDKA